MLCKKCSRHPNRPFYQSTQLLTIGTVNRDEYADFAMAHFAKNNLQLPREVFDAIYDKFDGHTWYIQKSSEPLVWL